MRVENVQRSEYCDILRAQCVLCRQENHVVCKSGPGGSDVNINCKVFGQCILNAIIEDINQCQQLLGQDCIELANFRKELHDMLSDSSQQSLTKNEVNLVIKFKNFIKKYIGVTGESWAFNPALKRVYRASRWMGKHQELSVSNQVKKIDALAAQKFGFKQQIIDIAKKLFFITQGRCGDIPDAGPLFLDYLEKCHISRENDRDDTGGSLTNMF
jgi:hypothetical protein